MKVMRNIKKDRVRIIGVPAEIGIAELLPR
jgi:hypothetical protein